MTSAGSTWPSTYVFLDFLDDDVMPPRVYAAAADRLDDPPRRPNSGAHDAVLGRPIESAERLVQAVA